MGYIKNNFDHQSGGLIFQTTTSALTILCALSSLLKHSYLLALCFFPIVLSSKSCSFPHNSLPYYDRNSPLTYLPWRLRFFFNCLLSKNSNADILPDINQCFTATSASDFVSLKRVDLAISSASISPSSQVISFT